MKYIKNINYFNNYIKFVEENKEKKKRIIVILKEFT